MKCPKCQFENPEDSIFCGDCGSPLAIVCPDCGAIPLPGFKFCDKCGHDLKTLKEPDSASDAIMAMHGTSLRFSHYRKYRWVLELVAILTLFAPIFLAIIISFLR